MIFRDYLFSLLSSHFKINDTYKDENDEGLLERYLRNFGQELDDEFIPIIENVTEQLSLNEAEAKFLVHFAYTLGRPPYINNDPELYRKLLENIVSIYKIKGTKKAYELLFGLLGFNVSLVEFEPKEYIYDENPPVLYDKIDFVNRATPPFYDSDCPSCSDYSIFYVPDYIDCRAFRNTSFFLNCIDTLPGGYAGFIFNITTAEPGSVFVFNDGTGNRVEVEYTQPTLSDFKDAVVLALSTNPAQFWAELDVDGYIRIYINLLYWQAQNPEFDLCTSRVFIVDDIANVSISLPGGNLRLIKNIKCLNCSNLQDIPYTFAKVSFTHSKSSNGAQITVAFTEAFSTNGSGVIVSRLWSFGDGTTSAEENPTHVYTEGNKSYLVSLLVNTSDGLTSRYTTRVVLIGNTPAEWVQPHGASVMMIGPSSTGSPNTEFEAEVEGQYTIPLVGSNLSVFPNANDVSIITYTPEEVYTNITTIPPETFDRNGLYNWEVIISPTSLTDSNRHIFASQLVQLKLGATSARAITAIEGDNASILAEFQSLICFLQPINANLRELSAKAPICEEVQLTTCERLIAQVFQSTTYDTEEIYDDTNTYDYILIDTITVETPGSCSIGCDEATPDFIISPIVGQLAEAISLNCGSPPIIPIPPAPSGVTNQTRIGDGNLIFTADSPAPGFENQWSLDGFLTIAHVGNSFTTYIEVSNSPITVYVRLRDTYNLITGPILSYTGEATPPFSFNNAWQFDGVNDFVSVPNAASLNFGSGNFSVSTWVRLNNTGLAQSIVAKRVGSGAGWFCLINQVGAAFLTVSDALVNRQLSTANGVFAFGVWQHVVFIRNGGTLNDWAIYVNGVNVRSLSANTDPGLIIDNAQPLRLMSNHSGAWCSGSMDETLIYNRALTPTEVATLYNGGAGNFPPASAMGNLVARYTFDTAAPSGPNFILNDSSGNGNHGTSSGISVSPLVPH